MKAYPFIVHSGFKAFSPCDTPNLEFQSIILAPEDEGAIQVATRCLEPFEKQIKQLSLLKKIMSQKRRVNGKVGYIRRNS